MGRSEKLTQALRHLFPKQPLTFLGGSVVLWALQVRQQHHHGLAAFLPRAIYILSAQNHEIMEFLSWKGPTRIKSNNLLVSLSVCISLSWCLALGVFGERASLH